MVATQKIDDAVKVVVGASRPNAVILFGSYARGSANDDSDVDLCVIEESIADRRAEAVRLRRALSPLRIPVDIVVHSAQVFHEWGEVSGTLFNSILKEGKVLYEKKTLILRVCLSGKLGKTRSW